MNPFEVLEIAPGASAEEIKAAYHRLAKKWHPDRFSGPEKTEAEQRFRMLAEAFNSLKNPARQAELPKQVPPQSAETGSTQISLDRGPEIPLAERTADDWYVDAKAAFETRDYERALGLSQYCIRLGGEKADYYLLMAKILDVAGGDQKALVKAYENVIRLNPKDVDSMIRLAELFQSVGMLARATKLWERARELKPDHKAFRQEQKNAKAKALDQATGLGEQFTVLLERGRALINRTFHRG